MASIGIMAIGAILNATAFVGGSYIAKTLSGSNKSDTERIRHDKAMEKYQENMAEYQEKRQKLIDWKVQQLNNEHQASQNFSKTDEALELYSQMHEPKFSDYYRPSDNQKMGRCYM